MKFLSHLERRLLALAGYLPPVYREGKMPYIIFFVGLVICILLTYAALTPQHPATPMLLALAVWLSLLVVFMNYGMPLVWGVHLGTLAGVFMIIQVTWPAGGVFSPRMTWLLILPLTPYYVIGRRHGFFWLVVVWLVQAGTGLGTYFEWVPAFEPSLTHVKTSWVTFSLVTGMLIIVPLIYNRLQNQAFEKSLRYQHELEGKQKELELALQMREHFIATVSHELRTPMNAILGFNALLLTQVQDKPQALKVLNHTHQSADHLMTVINDILDYSQLQAGKLVIQPETFELRRVAEHAFELFKPRVNSMELDYRIEWDEALPLWVNTDRHRLMQVLVNLLGNALKFTHQGSVVLRVACHNGGVIFSVQDTGIGIPKARQLNIFKRFSQAEDDTQVRYGGNGLGLAISQKLAHLLGGDIGFESEPGQGSRFWLHLPLSAVPAPSQKKITHKIEVQSAQMAWRFLVVDDHPINRLLVKQVLQSAWPASTVLEAVNGQQAMDMLYTESVDLVLMDMVMPVMDGIAATVALRLESNLRLSRLPVLGLTANVNPLDLERFKSAGLNEVMLKPFEPGALCAQVEHWLRGSR